MKKNGYYADGSKGTLQIVLFISTLAAILAIPLCPMGFGVATMAFMGIVILIGYAYHVAHLTKREIVGAMWLPIVVGIIAILPFGIWNLVGVVIASNSYWIIEGINKIRRRPRR